MLIQWILPVKLDRAVENWKNLLFVLKKCSILNIPVFASNKPAIFQILMHRLIIVPLYFTIYALGYGSNAETKISPWAPIKYMKPRI